MEGDVRAADAVWGPFDCSGNWMPHAGAASAPASSITGSGGSVCVDERGTEDPRLTYELAGWGRGSSSDIAG